MDDRRVGRAAVERGWVTEPQLEAARRIRDEEFPGLPLARVLVDRRWLTPEQAQELAGTDDGSAPTVHAERASEPEVMETVVPGSVVRSARLEVVRTLGPYRLQEEIGRGGMGAVYRAWHPELQAFFAVKVLTAGPDAPADLIERFRREGRAAARLRHPGIVAVHDIGEQDGKLYLVMDLVEGAPLDRMLARRPMPPAVAARWIAEIADAVQHAHECGVVHRDLKPGNVLCGSDGRFRVVDFGLAKVVDAGDAAQTKSGMLLGTPAYMAPEQADGRHERIDARTDVYQLGAILYHLLTGRAPHPGTTPMEVIGSVLHGDPVPPSRHVPGLDRGLEAVCRKALEREHDHRYPSARAFAEDCRRWLAGEPTVARPEHAGARVLRWMRRHRAITALSAILFLEFALALGSLLDTRRLSDLTLDNLRSQASTAVEAALAIRRAGGTLMDAEREFLPALEQAAREAARRVPDSPEPDYHLGRMYRVLERVEDARQAQTRALAKVPGFAPARYERAMALMHLWRARVGYVQEAWLRHSGALGEAVAAPAPVERVEEADAPSRELRAQIEEDLAVAAGAGDALSAAVVSCARALAGAMRRPPAAAGEIRASFAEAIAADPAASDASLALSEALAEEGRLDEAIQVLSGALAQDQGARELRLSLACLVRQRAARKWSLGEDALEDYRQSTHLGARTVELLPAERGRPLAWVRLGDTLAECGEYLADRGEDPAEMWAKAEQAYGEAVALAADSSRGWIGRGYVRTLQAVRKWHAGEDARPGLDAALADLDRAVALEPKSASARLGRGWARENRGQFARRSGEDPLPWLDAAIEDYGQSLALDPTVPQAHVARGTARLTRATVRRGRGESAEEDRDAAQADFDAAVSLAADLVSARVRRGSLALERAIAAGQRKEDPAPFHTAAREDLEHALRLAPGDGAVHFALGRLALDQGGAAWRAGRDPEPDWSAAETRLTRSLELRPTLVDAWLNRGFLNQNRALRAMNTGGNPREALARARADLDQVVRLSPAWAVGYRSRGELLLLWAEWNADAGEDSSALYQGAFEDYDHAVTLSPADARVRARRGSLYYVSRRWAEAIADFEEALRLDPGVAGSIAGQLDDARKKLIGGK